MTGRNPKNQKYQKPAPFRKQKSRPTSSFRIAKIIFWIPKKCVLTLWACVLLLVTFSLKGIRLAIAFLELLFEAAWFAGSLCFSVLYFIWKTGWFLLSGFTHIVIFIFSKAFYPYSLILNMNRQRQERQAAGRANKTNKPVTEQPRGYKYQSSNQLDGSKSHTDNNSNSGCCGFLWGSKKEDSFRFENDRNVNNKQNQTEYGKNGKYIKAEQQIQTDRTKESFASQERHTPKGIFQNEDRFNHTPGQIDHQNTFSSHGSGAKQKPPGEADKTTGTKKNLDISIPTESKSGHKSQRLIDKSKTSSQDIYQDGYGGKSQQASQHSKAKPETKERKSNREPGEPNRKENDIPEVRATKIKGIALNKEAPFHDDQNNGIAQVAVATPNHSLSNQVSPIAGPTKAALLHGNINHVPANSSLPFGDSQDNVKAQGRSRSSNKQVTPAADKFKDKPLTTLENRSLPSNSCTPSAKENSASQSVPKNNGKAQVEVATRNLSLSNQVSPITSQTKSTLHHANSSLPFGDSQDIGKAQGSLVVRSLSSNNRVSPDTDKLNDKSLVSREHGSLPSDIRTPSAKENWAPQSFPKVKYDPGVQHGIKKDDPANRKSPLDYYNDPGLDSRACWGDGLGYHRPQGQRKEEDYYKNNGQAQVAPRRPLDNHGPPAADKFEVEPLVELENRNRSSGNKTPLDKRNAVPQVPIIPQAVPKKPVDSVLCDLERNLVNGYLSKPVPELEPFVLNIWDQGNSAPYKDSPTKLLESSRSSRTIVYGLPGFGKSTLCYDIGRRWARARKDKQSSKPDVKLQNYALCIVLDVSRVHVTELDIEQCIVDRCQCLCQAGVNIREVILKVLNQSILILDGFQDIEGTSEKKLESFLESDFSKFKRLLITSRPVSSKSLVTRFERQVDICGCEDLHVKSIRKEACIPESTLKFFNGFSVLFQQLISNIKSKRKIETLFDLTESIINVILGRHPQLVVKENIFRSLGEFFLRSYVNKTYTFHRKDLEDRIGKGAGNLEIFLKKQIDGDKETLVICHNVFIRFFFVWYLREICKQAEKFSGFLSATKANGIDLDIADVYIVYNSANVLTRVSTFSLLPGIILVEEFSYKNSSLKFDFIEDYDKVFESSPWTTSSLLLQCDNKDLRKFGITEIEDTEDSGDNSIAGKFECIFNLLDFDNLTVSTPFYWNHLQTKMFLKLLVTNEETNSLGLTGVFCVGDRNPRSSKVPLSRLETTLLKFKYSQMGNTYPFLYRLFNTFERCCLPKSWQKLDCFELVFLILKTAVHTSLPCIVQVSLGTEVNSLSQSITWHVSKTKNGTTEPLYKTVTAGLEISTLEVISLNMFEGDSKDFREDVVSSDMFEDLTIRIRI